MHTMESIYWLLVGCVKVRCALHSVCVSVVCGSRPLGHRHRKLRSFFSHVVQIVPGCCWLVARDNDTPRVLITL